MSATQVIMIYNRISLCKNLRVLHSSFSTSAVFSSSWRKKLGLEPNPRTYSPLTLRPDYSFVDGRPVPLSFRKLKNMKYQENLCERIVELCNEIDAGLEYHQEKIRQKEIEKQTILKNKLKPKGAALKQKKSGTES